MCGLAKNVPLGYALMVKMASAVRKRPAAVQKKPAAENTRRPRDQSKEGKRKAARRSLSCSFSWKVWEVAPLFESALLEVRICHFPEMCLPIGAKAVLAQPS